MANLGPLYQNATYGNLLQIDGGLSAELKPVLDGDGNTSGLSLSLTGVGISGLVADIAGNLYGGLPGSIAYQSGPNVTAFTTPGVAGQVLASAGGGEPTWTNLVQNSTYSSFAADISGGSGGQIPFQIDVNNTSFVPAGTLGQVLVSGGTGSPYWSNSVPQAGLANNAYNISGGTPGELLYQSNVGTTSKVPTGTSGQVLVSNGIAAPSWNTLTAADVGSVPLDGTTAMTGNLSMGLHRINNLLTPSADNDAANKAYVDSIASGLKIKAACRVASTGDLGLDGPATVDGVSLNYLDRVLAKNQTDATQNGIYIVDTGGPWPRATDADTWAELVGATCFITEGSTWANTTWASNISVSGTLGTDPVTFVQFGASASYTAGTGLTLTGSQFSLTTPVSVANGGSGVTTLTGIIKGNGASAFSAATSSDVVSLIGTTPVSNATTAASCSGNAATATVLQNIRTINGIGFNGSANITVQALTPYAITFNANGSGDIAGTAWNGSAANTISFNTIGAAGATGSNASGTWSINVTGNAANVTGTVLADHGGTGYNTYAVGDLLYASGTSTLSKLGIASSDYVLRSNGTIPTWGKVELNTTVVTGTLPTTRGGTGLASPYATLGAVYANASTTLTTGILPISYGGTGADNATTARSNLGLAIGTNVQAYNAGLTDIAGLAKTDSNFIVGNGANWVAESGATARTSLGLGNIATISTTGSTTNFLRADGAWAAPTSASTGWTLLGSDTYTDNYILQGLTSKPSGAQYGDMAFQTAIWNGVSGMTGDRYSNLALCFSGNNYGASACGLTIFKTRGSTVASLVAAKYNTIENGWIGDDIGEIAMEGTDGQQYIKAGFITYAIDSAGKSGVGTADITVGQMPTRLAFATRDATITFPASSIVSGRAGQRFVIASTGTTNWTSIGASSTAVGTSFTYNGVAVTGTGTVYDVSSYSNQFGYGIIIDSKQNVYIAGSEHNAGNGKFSIGVNGYAPTYEYTHLSRTVGIASVTYYNGSTGGGSVINTTNGFSSTIPVYGFWYDQNTGLGNPSSSVATIICNTSEAARFTSSAITLSKPVTFSQSVSGTSATFNGTTTLRNDSLTTPDTGATTNVYRPTQGSVAQYYVGATASGQLYISSGGTPAFYSGSDYRLKTNIADIQNAIDVVKQLKPCSFNIGDNSDTQYGFVAHELQQAWGDAVMGEKDAVDADGNPIYQQVAYTKLVPVLTKCLVELIAKVEALEQANG